LIQEQADAKILVINHVNAVTVALMADYIKFSPYFIRTKKKEKRAIKLEAGI
jgi:hypothetical protein